MKNKLALIFVATMLAFSSTVLKASAQAIPFPLLSIQNTATGLCLDSDSSDLLGGIPGKIYTMRCNGGRFQKWSVVGSSDSLVLSHRYSSVCLDSDKKGAVYARGCNNGRFQKWIFTSNRTPSDLRSDGRYKNVATGLCLDSNNNGQVYASQCSGSRTGQNWGSQR
jgi:Ricin-type beta-trefoil lectin domain